MVLQLSVAYYALSGFWSCCLVFYWWMLDELNKHPIGTVLSTVKLVVLLDLGTKRVCWAGMLLFWKCQSGCHFVQTEVLKVDFVDAVPFGDCVYQDAGAALLAFWSPVSLISVNSSPSSSLCRSRRRKIASDLPLKRGEHTSSTGGPFK